MEPARKESSKSKLFLKKGGTCIYKSSTCIYCGREFDYQVGNTEGAVLHEPYFDTFETQYFCPACKAIVAKETQADVLQKKINSYGQEEYLDDLKCIAVQVRDFLKNRE